MKSAIEVITYDKCTGCYGCLNKCPVDGAIEFKKTEEGFYKPFLTEKCVQCGLCQKGCPVITKINRNNPEEIEVYSAWSKDNEILMNSSSGGIFSELAKVYLENNDVVFGAKWQDGEIVHCGITKLDELGSLQKSKYLQSKIKNSYREVKNYLNEGRKVLFVGTPCEIAALNTIVSHENLVTVDIVCHGIPSYIAYEKYIKETFNKDIDEIEVDFRNKKEKSWEKYDIVFKSNNQILTRNSHGKDIFFRGFLADIYLNAPCYNCEFRTMPRGADITLGDFWGVPENLKGPNGTSVVTLNNQKGKELFDKITKNIELKKANYQLALKGNPCLYNYKMDDSKRANFFKEINNLSFNELHKKYFPFPNLYISFIRRGLGFIKRRCKKILKGA